MLSEALQQNAKHEVRLSNISDLLLVGGSPEKLDPRFFVSLRMPDSLS
jgi:hypothetical protein